MPNTTLRPEDATFGLITALSHEYVAVQTVFGCAPVSTVKRAGSGRTYELARVPSLGGGEHIVALAQLADIGNTVAAIRVTNMLTDCSSIRYVIMVGIAGAVPNPKNCSRHVRLGDIVVCDLEGVIQYDLGSRKQRGIALRDRPKTPAIALIEAHKRLSVKGLKGDRPWEATLDRVIEELGSEWARPEADKDRLYDGVLRRLFGIPAHHPQDSERVDGLPRVFNGKIGSANVVLRDHKERDRLRESHAILAIEMEAGGVADAVFHAERSYFVVRGTCDYCNNDKNDDWQKYAAAAAAAYTRALIEQVPRAVAVPSDPNSRLPLLPEHATTPELPNLDDAPQAFISYVSEDEERIAFICKALEQAGIRVWRDRSHLEPGQRWKTKIRRAIESGDCFIAFFSKAYHKRSSTYMNEELTVAIEVLRQIATDRVWFIPVLLDQCSVPSIEIGAGARISDLHYVAFYSDKQAAIGQIINAIQIATPRMPSAQSTPAPQTNFDGQSKSRVRAAPAVVEELRRLKDSVEELSAKLIPRESNPVSRPADAQILVDAANKHLSVLEVDEAIKFIPLLEAWLRLHEEGLDPASIREVCTMIAELDILRHKRAKSHGEESTLSVAHTYLAKAGGGR